MSTIELLVGDRAPELYLATFLKGQPIEGFAPGRITVVEFWSPSCGPCVESIPHLSALQATYPQVTILAIAVQLTDAVQDFVSAKGEAMAFTVAADAPSTDAASFGPTYRAWCEAAYQDGIPTTFVVDGDGCVAWIGHPTDLDEPLAAIVEGHWDRAAEADAYRAMIARTKTREIAWMRAEAMRLYHAGDMTGALYVYDETFASHPDIERQWGIEKFKLLAWEGRSEVLDYARHLMSAAIGDGKLLLHIGQVLANGIRTARDSDQSVDPELASFAFDVLRQAEKVVPTDGLPRDLIWFRWVLANAFVNLNRPEEARFHAREARDLAATQGLEGALRERVDALADSCTAAPPTREPVMVCEGEVCRIAVA